MEEPAEYVLKPADGEVSLGSASSSVGVASSVSVEMERVRVEVGRVVGALVVLASVSVEDSDSVDDSEVSVEDSSEVDDSSSEIVEGVGVEVDDGGRTEAVFAGLEKVNRSE